MNHILIIDDDRIFTQILKNKIIAEVENTLVDIAFSKVEALSIFKSSKAYDLIIMDIELGPESGLQLASLLLNDNKINILFMTNHFVKNYLSDIISRFNLNEIRYCSKRNAEDIIDSIIQMLAQKKISLSSHFFSFRYFNGKELVLMNLPLSKILCANVTGNKLMLQTIDKQRFQLTGNNSLASFLKKVNPENSETFPFFKISADTAIHLALIDKPEAETQLLANSKTLVFFGEKFDVSDDRFTSLKKLL